MGAGVSKYGSQSQLSPESSHIPGAGLGLMANTAAPVIITTGLTPGGHGYSGEDPVTKIRYRPTMTKLNDAILNYLSASAAKPVVWTGGEDALAWEVRRHAETCKRAATPVRGRESIQGQLVSFMVKFSGTDQGIETCLMVGVSGIGKSTLMARAVIEAANQLKSMRATMLVRVVGATPYSHTALSICTSLALQAGKLPPQSYTDIPRCLRSIVLSATEDNPLILAIDGLDQLQDDLDQELRWLIPVLTEMKNPFVRVVLSTVPHPYCVSDLALQRSLLTLTRVVVPSLKTGPGGEAEALLDSIVASRKLPPLNQLQRQKVAEAFITADEDFGGVTPLWVHLLVDAEMYGAPNAAGGTETRVLPASAQECFDVCLDFMETAGNKSNEVILILSLITAARVGLTTDELVLAVGSTTATSMKQLLEQVRSAPGGWLLRAPDDLSTRWLWAHRLARDVAGYRYLAVMDRNGWDGYRDVMDKNIKKNILTTSDISMILNAHEDFRKACDGLADVLSVQGGGAAGGARRGAQVNVLAPRGNVKGSTAESGWTERAVRELPRAWAVAGKWNEVSKLVKNSTFMEAMCQVFGGAFGACKELKMVRRCAESARADSSVLIRLDTVIAFFLRHRRLLDMAFAERLHETVLLQFSRPHTNRTKPDHEDDPVAVMIENFRKRSREEGIQKLRDNGFWVFSNRRAEKEEVDVCCYDVDNIIPPTSVASNQVNRFTTSLDGTFVVALVGQLEIRVFDGFALREKWSEFSSLEITALAVSNDSMFVATATGASIYVYDTRYGTILSVLEQAQHGKAEGPLLASCLAFGNDGSLLASDHVGRLHQWHLREEDSYATVIEHRDNNPSRPFMEPKPKTRPGGRGGHTRRQTFRDTDETERHEIGPNYILSPDGATVAWYGPTSPSKSIFEVAVYSLSLIPKREDLSSLWRYDSLKEFLAVEFSVSGMYLFTVTEMVIACSGSTTGKILWRVISNEACVRGVYLGSTMKASTGTTSSRMKIHLHPDDMIVSARSLRHSSGANAHRQLPKTLIVSTKLVAFTSPHQDYVALNGSACLFGPPPSLYPLPEHFEPDIVVTDKKKSLSAIICGNQLMIIPSSSWRGREGPPQPLNHSHAILAAAMVPFGLSGLTLLVYDVASRLSLLDPYSDTLTPLWTLPISEEPASLTPDQHVAFILFLEPKRDHPERFLLITKGGRITRHVMYNGSQDLLITPQAFDTTITPYDTIKNFVSLESYEIPLCGEQEKSQIPVVTCAVVSPDSQWVIIGDSNGSIRLIPILEPTLLPASSSTELNSPVSPGSPLSSPTSPTSPLLSPTSPTSPITNFAQIQLPTSPTSATSPQFPNPNQQPGFQLPPPLNPLRIDGAHSTLGGGVQSLAWMSPQNPPETLHPDATSLLSGSMGGIEILSCGTGGMVFVWRIKDRVASVIGAIDIGCAAHALDLVPIYGAEGDSNAQLEYRVLVGGADGVVREYGLHRHDGL
ncbi:NACHT domain- and WD repeat-containing protein 1 [Blyttiomyces sp. JEL0837]|nr:NACHT domain- and WD repeat-containing protein 1 [Blyttiomyces sp. JEL0837]